MICQVTWISSFREKQRQLEAIREKLAAQLKQKLDDEDERIREAVREAEEKRAKEEAEKDAKMKKTIAEQAEHRNIQVYRISLNRIFTFMVWKWS